jgi:HemK-like putative methylase
VSVFFIELMVYRQETAAFVIHLSHLLHGHASKLPSHLRVLDLCTGSGCIPLLFAHSWLLQTRGRTSIEAVGVDISSKAITLARENQQEQAAFYPSSAIKKVDFMRANLFEEQNSSQPPSLLDTLRKMRQTCWDIIISNPPYISPEHFNHTTTRSVRNFEPKQALVPNAADQGLTDNDHGDLFYPRLLEIAKELNTKIMLLEVGDLEQAKRVASLAKGCERWTGVEIWRDDPGAHKEGESDFQGIPIRGEGHGRSVLLWRSDGASWLGK